MRQTINLRPTSWRESIQVHPAADKFPLLADADLVALAKDIKRAGGLVTPIAITVEDGKPCLLDGRNRLDAMERLGWQPKLWKAPHGTWHLSGDNESELDTIDGANAVYEYFYDNPAAYVASVNIHRRHLTPESKRALIAQLLRQNPERSDRATAALVKVDGKTVAAVRRQQEACADIPHVEARVDTKGRQQPASKHVPVTKPTPTAPSRETPSYQAGAVAISRLAEACRIIPPTALAADLQPGEAAALRNDVAVIDAWLSRFVVAIDDRGGRK